MSIVIPDDITLAQCEEVFGINAPQCVIYKRPKEQHVVAVKFLNPFNINTRDFAFRVKRVIDQIGIPTWSAITGNRFETVDYSSGSGEVRILVNEYGNKAIPLATALVVAVIAIPTALLIYGFIVISNNITREKIQVSNNDLAKQIGDKFPPEEAKKIYEQLWPKGITDGNAAQPFDVGATIGLIGSIVPLFLVLALIGGLKGLGSKS